MRAHAGGIVNIAWELYRAPYRHLRTTYRAVRPSPRWVVLPPGQVVGADRRGEADKAAAGVAWPPAAQERPQEHSNVSL